MPEHKHEWKSSAEEIGLVGDPYRHIWPLCCECGALKKYDGTILEPPTPPSNLHRISNLYRKRR